MSEDIILDILQDVHSDNKMSHALKSINLEVTEKCNLACLHCYMSAIKALRNDILSSNDIKKFILRIKQLYGTDILIGLTGGEPLIRKDMFELLEFIHGQGFSISLATNGLLINESNIKILEEYLTSISISLDGSEESHNSLRNSKIFDKTIQAIKLATKSNIKNVSIKTVVSTINIDELTEIWDLVNKLKIQSWHLIPLEPLGRGEQNKDLLLNKTQYLKLCNFVDKIRAINKTKIKLLFEEQPEQLSAIKTCDWGKYKKCMAGVNFFSVLKDGSIVSCLSCDRKGISLRGNIKTDDIGTIWEESFCSERDQKYQYCGNHYYLNLIEGKNEHKN